MPQSKKNGTSQKTFRLNKCSEMRGRTKSKIHERGKVGNSNGTPIKIFLVICTFLENGSSITPSYFPACMKWSLLVLPLISLYVLQTTVTLTGFFSRKFLYHSKPGWHLLYTFLNKKSRIG